MEIARPLKLAMPRMSDAPAGMASRWGFKPAITAIALGAAVIGAGNMNAAATRDIASLGKPEVRNIESGRGLPRAVNDYRAARLDRGCLIEAIVFADWFMTQNFDGKKTAAQVVAVNPRMGDKRQAHAMVVFSHQDKFYSWDMNYGAQPLDVRGAKSMAEAAEHSFERLYDNDLRTAESGIGKFNEQKSVELPRGADTFSVAVQRLNETRPVLLLDVTRNAQKTQCLATLFEGHLYIFDAEIGAKGGAAVTAENLGATLSSVVHSVYGDTANFKITKQLAPRT